MQTVYVLNQILDDGTVCTSVFKHFTACVNSVIMELKQHSGDYVYPEQELIEIQKELENQMYYTDGFTKYYIEQCRICEDKE